MKTQINELPPALNSSALLARFLESFTEALQLVDLSGQVLWSNTQAQQLLGLSHSGSQKTSHWTALWNLTEPVLASAAFDDAVAGKRSHFQAGYTTATGKDLWLEFDLVPLPETESTPHFLYVVCKDRTGEHRSAAELARLEVFVACTADAVIGFGYEGVITFWNTGAERIFGYTQQEAIGQKYTLIATLEMQKEQKRTYAQLSSGMHRRQDTQRLRKDGTLVDVSITSSPIIVGGQKMPGGVVVIHDNTEKVQAMEELRLRKEQMETTLKQMQLALAAAQMGTFISDLVTGGIVLSESTRMLFKLPPEIAITTRQSIYDYCHPDDHERIQSAIAESRATGMDFTVEFRALPPEGGPRWLAARGRVERGPEGEPQRLLGVIWDIDKHKREAEELALLAAFVSCTGDAIIGFDRVGNITHWNRGAQDMFGYTPEEALGQSYTLIGTTAVYAFQHRVFSETIRGDTHRWYDTQRRCKDGRVLDVSVTTSPLIIGGEIVGLVGIVREITEKVRATQQLAELNNKLQATAEEKRQFVNMILHDLRHPLTTVKTLLYLLRHDTITARDEHLEVIEGRVSALHLLLEELTEYHRIEAGRGYITVEQVSVAELIQECVTNFQPVLVGAEVQIQCTVTPELDLVLTDRNKLLHILLNLLSNALKFTPQGQITVQANSVAGDHWRLIVEDTGLGIPEEVQAHIFEEFYQGDALTHKRQGFGLGLSIVKQLCDTLQGKLELTSTQGKGTRFALVFPQVLVSSSVNFP
ncbi:PAS domain S-box protein [Armatimonas sp.]|uniref:PAS domain-containing sensor histidine kinase n=1 Tax=Armatimonas sp. TaxID=1872638 RepID=UPI00374DBDB4